MPPPNIIDRNSDLRAEVAAMGKLVDSAKSESRMVLAVLVPIITVMLGFMIAVFTQLFNMPGVISDRLERQVKQETRQSQIEIREEMREENLKIRKDLQSLINQVSQMDSKKK